VILSKKISNRIIIY